MLRVRDISVQFGTQTVLDRVSVSCRAGELTAILGPNGAGKTTLLRALSGELMPNKGAVEFAGRPVRRGTSKALARRRAVLSQANQMPFSLTVEQVVLLGRLPHQTRGPTSDDYRVVYEVLRDVDAQAWLDRPIDHLSGGEQQRIHFARVLAQAGRRSGATERALLLDEPTAAMDPSRALQILRLAREEAESGAAVVAILHDLNLAAAYADRIVLLRRGHVHADGPPNVVVTSENIREVFDVDAVVRRHPFLDRPSVVIVESRASSAVPPARAVAERTGQHDTQNQPSPCPLKGVHGCPSTVIPTSPTPSIAMPRPATPNTASAISTLAGLT